MANKKIWKKAAIDITNGWAANEFIKNPQNPNEPWAEKAFITVTDALINHEYFFYPHSSKGSIKESRSIEIFPQFLHHLQRKELLCSYEGQVASDVELSNEHLSTALETFKTFVIKEYNNFSLWLSFHRSPEMKAKHLEQAGSDVQKFIEQFWSSTAETSKFADEQHFNSNDLRYAFDTFVRGQQYEEIINGIECLYFNHPIRKWLFKKHINLRQLPDKKVSFGMLLAKLIKNGIHTNQMDEVCNTIGRLRKKVKDLHANWYQLPFKKDSEDLAKRVVAESKLRSKVTEEMIKALTAIFAIVGANIDARLNTYGLVTLILELGVIQLKTNDRYIPSSMGKLKIIRGFLEDVPRTSD